MLLGLTTYSIYHHFIQSKIEACGIIGITGNEECVDYLLEGLLILQNRGYDSAGVATLHEQFNPNTNQNEYELVVTKHASKGTTSDSLDLLKHEAPVNHSKDRIGLAHTRWATHGAKTDINAHPHCDYKKRLALIHNGTIQNCHQIKSELIKKGIPFVSQTDTEVIANLIGFYLDVIDETTGKSKYSMEDAMHLALSRLEGSWGIAILYKDRPNEIFAARYGSPLMIGLDPAQKRNFIASEHTAFSRYTNEYIPLNDGEIAVISSDNVSLDKSRVQKAPTVMHDDITLSPEPYKHWTIKEIMDQPLAISRALSYGSRLSVDETVKLGGLEKSEDLVLGIKHLVITGCGTSYHAGLFAQRLMQYLKSFETVAVVDAAEVTSDTFPPRNAGLLAVSQSGETKDVINCVVLAEQLAIPRFSVVNAIGSHIARMTNLGVYTYAGREHGVASTKTFVSQVTVLALIAAWFAQHHLEQQQEEDAIIEKSSTSPNPSQTRHIRRPGESVDQQRRSNLIQALHRLPTYCGVTLHNVHEDCKKIAAKIQKANHIFVLGKGFAEPIAEEGALKIKEITYIHAEGYSGGALKHGPFALIEEGTPVIMIILDDQHSKTMITNAHEIESRGGKMIYVTDNIDLLQGLKGDVIKIPSNGCLTALLAVLPLQLLAYELAVLKNINPDKPKNLAKAVTVD